MKTQISSLLKIIDKYLKIVAINRTARELSRLTERQLKDIGISPAKLQQGAAAYPWREAVEKVEVIDFVNASKRIDTHVNALLETHKSAA